MFNFHVIYINYICEIEMLDIELSIVSSYKYINIFNKFIFFLYYIINVNFFRFTLDIIGNFYIFAFVNRADLKQPLARPIYIRPPENNYKGPWIRHMWIYPAPLLSLLLTCRHSEFDRYPSPLGYTFCPRSWILPAPWHPGARWDAIHPESTVYHFPGIAVQQRNANRWMI